MAKPKKPKIIKSGIAAAPAPQPAKPRLTPKQKQIRGQKVKAGTVPALGKPKAQPKPRAPAPATGTNSAVSPPVSSPDNPQAPFNVPTAPTQPTVAPPPTLPEQEQARQEALMNEQEAVANANRQRYEAALRYGDPDLIAQIAAQTGGVAVPDNPLSDLDTIARNEQLGLKSVGEQANQGNTFFSGLHLVNRGKVGEQAGFNRAEALQRYRGSETDLTNAIAHAHLVRQQAFDRALAEEVQAATSGTPEATGELGPSPYDRGEQQDVLDLSDTKRNQGKTGGGGKGKGKGGKKKPQQKKGSPPKKKAPPPKKKPAIKHGIGPSPPPKKSQPPPKKKGKK